MIPTEKTIRHISEAYLVRHGLEGDASSASQVIQQLNSTRSNERRVMIETLHDLADPELCTHLLQCLALQRWDQHRDCDLRADPQASERIDQAIIEFFREDEDPIEKTAKEKILSEALGAAEPAVRHAAAYLLGQRGDPRGLPVLEECLKSGKQIWKLRAIQALGSLNEPECGGSLINALSLDRDVLHKAALEGLKQLGGRIEPAWQEALDHADPHTRWQAARGLAELGNPRGAGILAEGLLDENPDVHWPTAEVIATLGPAALPAVLEVIGRGKLPGSTRQAAYSALQRLTNRESHELLKPLLEALSTPATSGEAPAAARRALKERQFSETPSKRSRHL